MSTSEQSILTAAEAAANAGLQEAFGPSIWKSAVSGLEVEENME